MYTQGPCSYGFVVVFFYLLKKDFRRVCGRREGVGRGEEGRREGVGRGIPSAYWYRDYGPIAILILQNSTNHPPPLPPIPSPPPPLNHPQCSPNPESCTCSTPKKNPRKPVLFNLYNWRRCVYCTGSLFRRLEERVHKKKRLFLG